MAFVAGYLGLPNNFSQGTSRYPQRSYTHSKAYLPLSPAPSAHLTLAPAACDNGPGSCSATGGLHTISLPLAFLGGILSFASPCVLPLLPSYLALLTAGGGVRRHVRIFHAAGFVLGFGVVFILLGLSATVLGHLLAEQRTLLRDIGGVLVILFGLFMLGLQPNLLLRDMRFHYTPRQMGFGSALLVGAAFGFGWTACVTPWLGSILILAAQTTSWQQGGILLVAYALGLGVPFLLLGILADRLVERLAVLRRSTRLLEQIGGALLVLLGVLMITGALERLSGLGSFF